MTDKKNFAYFKNLVAMQKIMNEGFESISVTCIYERSAITDFLAEMNKSEIRAHCVRSSIDSIAKESSEAYNITVGIM